MNFRSFLTAGLAGSLILASTAGQAAFDAYMTINGSKQGQFKGTSTKHPGTSKVSNLVSGFEFSIASPRDPQSGLPTGKRMHKPFTITREVDAASPQIYQALSNGELLPAVRVTVYKTTNGQETIDYTVELTGAQITGDKRYAGKTPAEDVSFTYQKITITWAGSPKIFTDVWQPTK